MSHRLNIGVLGCANIAIRSVIPAIQSLPDHFNLIGIASRSLNKATKIANRFNTKGFGSYRSLLETGNLDAVYIPLPTGLHKEWIENALKGNVHVLSEKSLVTNLNDALELTELARAENRILMENFQFRFHKQLSEIIRMLEEGRIGELRSVRASFGFPPFPDKNNIRYNSRLGGGALLDAGVYTIKISQILLGQDLDVIAASSKVDKKSGVDIRGSGLLKSHKSDVTSHIAFGFDHYYQCGIDVWGTDGRLQTNRLFTASAEISPVIHIESNQENTVLNIEKDDHFQNMLLHFHDLIVKGLNEKVEEEHQQNLNQARLIDQFKRIRYES
ncbi:MAG: Gfo/Idh/MocA family oxidoreductase [Balneolaceae bacterium]